MLLAEPRRLRVQVRWDTLDAGEPVLIADVADTEDLLCTAAAAGDVATVLRLLSDEPTSALHYAVVHGQADVVRAMLGRLEMSPQLVLTAAEHGHYDIVALLLGAEGSDPGAMESMIFRQAAGRGDRLLVSMLLEDARVNPDALSSGALCQAAARGHLRVVRELLNDGRSTNLVEALRGAARGHHRDVVVCLIGHPCTVPKCVIKYLLEERDHDLTVMTAVRDAGWIAIPNECLDIVFHFVFGDLDTPSIRQLFHKL